MKAQKKEKKQPYRTSQRKKHKKLSMTPFISCISALIMFIILCILVIIFIFVFPHRLGKGKSISITADNANPNRISVIEQYLEPAPSDISLNTDSFKITVTPISKEDTVIHVKNNTTLFFTGNIIIHDQVTLSLKSMAPNSSENFNVNVSLASDATDYTCDGEFYTFEDAGLLPFELKEEALGNDQFKCYLSVSDFDETAQKSVANYYYILDTLYNFSTATEYQLFNEDGSISYGKMIVDATSQSVSYYKDDQLIFTERY